MVIAVPAVPTVGVKLAMVGARLVVIVKADPLVVVPDGVVMLMVPVVAPLGTTTTSWFVVALVTVAAVPLKVTASWLAVAENPVPLIVIVLPGAAPVDGEMEMIETIPASVRVIESRLPTASYV
jgi:hypothetical protein